MSTFPTGAEPANPEPDLPDEEDAARRSESRGDHSDEGRPLPPGETALPPPD